MKKYMLICLVTVANLHYLHADITSKHLILPKETWEVGVGYLSATDDEDGMLLSLRYGISNRLSFIPFGLAYAPINTTLDHLLVFANIEKVEHGTIGGFQYETNFGGTYRREITNSISATLLASYNDIVAERYFSGYRHNAGCALAYTFYPLFTTGVQAAYQRSEEKTETNEPSSHINTTIEKRGAGLFFYWYPQDYIDLKIGYSYATEENQSDDLYPWSADKEKSYTSMEYKVVWRF